jgi:hypothetical protein
VGHVDPNGDIRVNMDRGLSSVATGVTVIRTAIKGDNGLLIMDHCF